MKRTLRTARAVLLLASGAVLAGCMTKATVGNDPTVEGTVHVCSSCHGLEGRSENPNFPILAGQQHDYLVQELHAFRDKTRADPHAHTYMWGMAAKLSDTTIDGLATYFSQQPPAPPTRQDPALASAGAAIFKAGIAARDVPACSACHGDTGGGNGAIPRLAGQHPAYLATQLQAFQVNSRANEMMHQNAKNLTPQEIDEVTAYLGSI
ncbi:MAG TPA: c-type cytochrome [Acetobacteraceae bacterium]|nr:c-type cytochrome [Acetobacteraceae bacterium]